VTLVDTSVWIDHFRRGNLALMQLLEEGEVAIHPMILGELACGSLPRRAQTLGLLFALPRLDQAPDGAVLHAIDAREWWSKGIGWIDAHLLAAALLSNTPLWTLDRRLRNLAVASGEAFLH
jgi:predicted nucleic acid-binding protein